MRHDLRLLRILFQDREKKSRQSHRHTRGIDGESSSESGLRRKTQDRDLGKAAKSADFLTFYRSAGRAKRQVIKERFCRYFAGTSKSSSRVIF
jgi:hypothetical protein